MKRKHIVILILLILAFSLSLMACFGKRDKPSNSDNTSLVKENSACPPYLNSFATFEDYNNLSNQTLRWGLKHNSLHDTPEVPGNIKDMIGKYSSYFIGDTNSKVIYLTFDEGYENGYTERVLDILKKHNIKAAFFVTKPYIVQNKDLINRMLREGHIVGNHSSKHPSMPTRTGDISLFNEEFFENEKAFYEATGSPMSRYFRPPMGEFSEKSLYLTQHLGYKTIFWSFAYDDWDLKKQPDVDYAINKILSRCHKGEIMLLHTVSKTNAEILDWVILELKGTGYRFGELGELK